MNNLKKENTIRQWIKDKLPELNEGFNWYILSPIQSDGRIEIYIEKDKGEYVEWMPKLEDYFGNYYFGKQRNSVWFYIGSDFDGVLKHWENAVWIKEVPLKGGQWRN